MSECVVEFGTGRGLCGEGDLLTAEGYEGFDCLFLCCAYKISTMRLSRDKSVRIVWSIESDSWTRFMFFRFILSGKHKL